MSHFYVKVLCTSREYTAMQHMQSTEIGKLGLLTNKCGHIERIAHPRSWGDAYAKNP